MDFINCKTKYWRIIRIPYTTLHATSYPKAHAYKRDLISIHIKGFTILHSMAYSFIVYIRSV